MFFKQMRLDSSIYMVATNEQVKAHRETYWLERSGESWVRELSADEEGEGAGLMGELDEMGPFCDSAFKMRLTVYEEHHAATVALQGPMGGHMCNLMQHCSFMQTTGSVAPSLLRASFLYDLVKHREVFSL